MGPGNIGGRTRALLIDPTNVNTMYARGVAAGVWKSTNAGASWSALNVVAKTEDEHALYDFARLGQKRILVGSRKKTVGSIAIVETARFAMKSRQRSSASGGVPLSAMVCLPDMLRQGT